MAAQMNGNSSNTASGGSPDSSIIQSFVGEPKTLQLVNPINGIESVKYSGDNSISLVYTNGREEIYSFPTFFDSREDTKSSGLLIYIGTIICVRDETVHGGKIMVRVNYYKDRISFTVEKVYDIQDMEGENVGEHNTPIFILTLRRRFYPEFELNVSLDPETIKYKRIDMKMDGKLFVTGTYYCLEGLQRFDGKFVRLNPDGTMVFEVAAKIGTAEKVCLPGSIHRFNIK